MARAIAPCRLLASLSTRPLALSAPWTSSPGRRYLQKAASGPAESDFAFAFDIDGVLVRSAEPLPRAAEALTLLHERRIPFVLLTNGGGKPEAERVAELGACLGVPLDPRLFVQSHTPFAELVHGAGDGTPALRDECVLVVGGEGDRCRQVAESYGFTNVVTPSDIYAANPDVWPFSQPFDAYHHAHARPLPLPLHATAALPVDPAAVLRIAAALVFNDPRDWGLDAALLVDLLLSHRGIPGTRSPLNGRADRPQCGYLQDAPPALHWSNPDLWFAARWHLPRLGAGGFRAACEGLWRAACDGAAPLPGRLGGKPHASAFAFAERRLVEARKRAGGGPLRRVYMVGDNPASDILGANAYRSALGAQWTSILVRSGVWAGEVFPSEAHQPEAAVSDVWAAVRWALDREVGAAV